VAERSGASAEGATGTLKGRSELAELWLEHLLLLSMLQHTSGQWRWGRFVVVHPAGNSDYTELCSRYRTLLEDQSTFAPVTLEEFLAAGALPEATVAALRDRYLPG
jgi:PD-(D/E)XK nuclease superfamily